VHVVLLPITPHFGKYFIYRGILFVGGDIMLGETIKELRDARDLTQERLAAIMGLSRPTITKYERNERIPDLIIATRMAEYFGVSLDYLCGRKPSAKEKLAYEIVTMFDRRGLIDCNIENNGFRKVLTVVSFALDTYFSSEKK
jgi:transcriptional regulator with XRE-family HTH domain